MKIKTFYKKYSKTLFIALSTGVFLGILIFAFSPRPQQSLGECLTSKGVVMYGADTCSHCQDQKSIFGKDFENVSYVNCEFEYDLCKKKGVTSYPVWSYGNKVLLGTQSKKSLATFAECSIIP